MDKGLFNPARWPSRVSEGRGMSRCDVRSREGVYVLFIICVDYLPDCVDQLGNSSKAMGNLVDVCLVGALSGSSPPVVLCLNMMVERVLAACMGLYV